MKPKVWLCPPLKKDTWAYGLGEYDRNDIRVVECMDRKSFCRPFNPVMRKSIIRDLFVACAEWLKAHDREWFNGKTK